MSLNKRTYVDQETVITAENLNDIQDEIILNGQNIGKHAGVFAPPYDDTATYALGAYCTYNNQMYKCTTAIATPEDWTGEHWTTVTIGNELSTKEENVQSDWNQADSTKDDFIKNKPTIPAAQIQSDWDQSDTNAKDFIKNKPTIPAAQIQSDWDQTDNTAADYIKNKPNIGVSVAVLTSDEYSSSSAYAVGDYCIYNNTLYRCTTAIGTGGEAWTAAHWQSTNVGKELVAERESIDQLVQESAFEIVVEDGEYVLYWYGAAGECPYSVVFESGEYVLYFNYSTT